MAANQPIVEIEDYRSNIAQAWFHVEGKPMSLEHYPMYKAIYDGYYPKLLLKTGRQVAKCVHLDTRITQANGKQVFAKDLIITTPVLSLDVSGGGAQFTTQPVVWKSKIYNKPCVRIKTRQGQVLIVATTHPFRVWNDWQQAKRLRVGDRIAVVRQGGLFTGTARIPLERIRLTAYLIGDGHTNCISKKTGTPAVAVRTHRAGLLRQWITEDGLLGCSSADKFVPSWVFDLSRKRTALFINRLWATDGNIQIRNSINYMIEYSSISSRLIYDVQALLWKFGIPSCVRTYIPKLYRDRGVNKPAYRLRIESMDGVYKFLKEIGSLGKSEKIPLPTHTNNNNNRYTLPQGFSAEITQLTNDAGEYERRGRSAKNTLHADRLPLTPKYPLTYTKASKYIAHFRRHRKYNQTQVDRLEAHLNSALYWDRIVSIEHVGIQPCIDFEIAHTHNFIADGIVTHNSTTIASFMIADCVGTAHFKTYYISPSQEQTRKFSHTRISKILAYSPDLREAFIGPESIDNVLLRLLKNGSEMAFTYALDDADRARGFSADLCTFDEIQEMLYDSVVPIIEECMSNSKFAHSLYAGTPKTMENTIEYLWGLSSQSEWCMKCESCGKYTYVDSAKAIGPVGPVCLACKHLLNPRHGRWIDMRPGSKIKGFHIPQPIMPENVPSAWSSNEDQARAMLRWQRILDKQEQYGEVQFLNEVIGVSTSTGARLLTKEILESLCRDYEMTRLPLPDSKDAIIRTVAGVDWSGGGGEVKGMEGLVKSRTVLHIFGDLGDGMLKTLFYKIFPNGHPTGWIDEIVELCIAWGVELVCGDAGEGALANAMLRERLGAHKVLQVRYMALSQPVKWNSDTSTYHVDRTTLIDNFARFLTKRQAIYPRLKQAQSAIDDILNVYEETTLAGRKVWRHAPTQPDDCLHAQLFSWFAWRLLCRDLEFYSVSATAG